MNKMLIMQYAMTIGLAGIAVSMAYSYVFKLINNFPFNLGDHAVQILWMVVISGFAYMQFDALKKMKEAQKYAEGKVDMDAMMEKFEKDVKK